MRLDAQTRRRSHPGQRHGCLSRDQLERLYLGTVTSGREATHIRYHLLHCAACCRAFAKVAVYYDLLRRELEGPVIWQTVREAVKINGTKCRWTHLLFRFASSGSRNGQQLLHRIFPRRAFDEENRRGPYLRFTLMRVGEKHFLLVCESRGLSGREGVVLDLPGSGPLQVPAEGIVELSPELAKALMGARQIVLRTCPP